MNSKGINLCKVSYALVVIGAINWGLVGIGGFVGSDVNIIHFVFGTWPQLEWVVYLLTGISGAKMLMKKSCCGGGSCSPSGGM